MNVDAWDGFHNRRGALIEELSGAGNVVGGIVVVGGSVDAGLSAAAWVAAVVDGVAGVSSSSVSAQPPVTPAPTRSSARMPSRKRAGRRTDTAAGRGIGVGLERRGSGAMAWLYHPGDPIA